MPLSKRINSVEDMQRWKSCPGYQDYLAFVRQLNDAVKGAHSLLAKHRDGSSLPSWIKSVFDLLSKISALVDSIPPLESDTTQRFGNKAYRVWYDRMECLVKEVVQEEELSYYLKESFGNKQRIDYGTGHEMNFVIFMMGGYRLHMMASMSSPSKEGAKDYSQQLIVLFSNSYLPLVRKVQRVYTLEPAGSHGVFSLDDFQFLPFLWGSSQLSAHPNVEPSNFPDKAVAERYSQDFLFHSAIHFIHTVKKGLFAEHSNQLWNISGVESWEKINRGLMKMYENEVLQKFPVVQHLLFGDTVLRWG